MKKCLVWLLAAALLLAGCGKKTASQAESLRQRYREMQAAHMEAEITCHLETENRTFTVSCDWTPTGAGTTVTGPEDLAGLTASVSGEELTVSYDGAALSAGSLRDVAPANCLPWLLRAMEEDAEVSIAGLKVDGGASANDFLMQFQADILGNRVYRPECIETTALGAAYLAGLSSGYYESRQQIRENWQLGREFVHEMSESKRELLLKGWKRAVKCALVYAEE